MNMKHATEWQSVNPLEFWRRTGKMRGPRRTYCETRVKNPLHQGWLPPFPLNSRKVDKAQEPIPRKKKVSGPIPPSQFSTFSTQEQVTLRFSTHLL